MPGLVDAKGPCYISSHSADVILSEIRPTKLKPDALRAINTLLDEFLYKILSTSGTLATDKLRTSLLSLLPTNLGKEALLEAEVELRAYWERTESRDSMEDDGRTFHLQWAFELLRLKCEAYSTLNEADEDPNLEGRVTEKLGIPHPHPPKVLVDPAALYLTAILESICEHILSNVGRVVARDSSRAVAAISDLFVALCEDVSIYGLFKTMEVYEQIEVMSKGPQPRRSKSFTRNDPAQPSRTSSPQELTRVNSSSGSRSRRSADRQSLATNPGSGSGSVTGASFEKSRAIRMFVNSKERDGDSQFSHIKSDSLRSETSRQDDDIPNNAEDAAILREFDDLMRSTSTMKVSLTPDRLRTMEVYKQEKDQRDLNRRPPPHFSLSNSDPSAPLPIIEDEELNHPPETRLRQGSIASQPTSPFTNRIRSLSTTSSTGIHSTSKSIRPPSVQAPPPLTYKIPGAEMMQTRDLRKPSDIGIPARTRDRQHRRESLDIDDVLNGSDDDGGQGSVLKNPKLPHSTQRISRAQYPVSAHTRELMAFLAEGPPEPKVSQSGKELLDFLAQGPPEYMTNATDSPKSKSAGRLQRMISKLSIGGEKAKPSPEVSRPPSFKQPSSPVRQTPSLTTLSSLANRPIPPRFPLASPPPSPRLPTPPRDSGQDTPSPLRESPVIEKAVVVMPVPVPLVIVPPNKDVQEKEKPARRPVATSVNGNVRNGPSSREVSPEPQQPISPVRTISRKAAPSLDLTSTPFFTETDAKDMQYLLTNASTADECRLIFDMFIARNNVSKASTRETDAPYPSPSPSLIKHAPLVQSSVAEALVESTLVEFFLSDIATPAAISQIPSEENQPDPPTEALAVVTETLVDTKPVVNSPPPSKNHTLPIPQHPSSVS